MTVERENIPDGGNREKLPQQELLMKEETSMYTMIPFTRRNMANRTNDLFDDRFFRSFFNMNDFMGNTGFRVDIREEDDKYVLQAELPGVEEDKINLTLENDTLSISADYETANEDGRTCYSERRKGHVERSFTLDGIVQDQITAAYKNGILTVNLPKEKPTQNAGQRKIPINAAAAE